MTLTTRSSLSILATQMTSLGESVGMPVSAGTIICKSVSRHVRGQLVGRLKVSGQVKGQLVGRLKVS